jgi:hypothetical protein
MVNFRIAPERNNEIIINEAFAIASSSAEPEQVRMFEAGVGQVYLKASNVLEAKTDAISLIQKWKNAGHERKYTATFAVKNGVVDVKEVYIDQNIADEVIGNIVYTGDSGNYEGKVHVKSDDIIDARSRAIEIIKNQLVHPTTTGKESVEIIDDDEIDTGKKNDSKPTKEKKEENWINCTCAGCSHIKMLNAIKQFKCKAKVFKKGKKIEYAKMPIFCDKFGPKKSTVNG